MRNRSGKTIRAAAARIREADITHARRGRPFEHASVNASLDDFAAYEGFKVGSKLAAIFSARRNRVALIGAVYDALRERRIEVAASALRDQDARVAFRSKVARPCRIGLAAAGVGRRDRNQRAAGCRERGANSVENGAVGICRAGFIAVPERDFIGDDRDSRDAAKASKRSGSNFNVDAIRER